MYDKIMIANNRLIATSDSEKELFVGKQNDFDLSMKEITTKNKMEECEKRILMENKKKIMFRNAMKQYQKKAYICYGISAMTTVLLFLLAIMFMPFTPLVSNVGLLTWLTTFITGGCFGHKYQNKVNQEYEKINDSEEYCNLLKQKMEEEKTSFNVLKMIHQKDNKKQIKTEQSYNEQLKNDLIEFKDELQKLACSLKEAENGYTKKIRK